MCLLSHPVTIKSLSTEVLLKIFCYSLFAVSPRIWPTIVVLVHTCRHWRRIVFAYQRALHLRLFFSRGMPVKKDLDCWSTFPIAVQYGGSLEDDLPTPEDEDNIMAALKQSNRVISISLTITTALQARLYTIKSPFSDLEDLILLSRDHVRSLHSCFRWSFGLTQLRKLHLTRILVSGLPQLLRSSRNLVDLRLHEVIYHACFPTESLKNTLFEMAQLRSLSLYFLPHTYNISASLPSRKRITLPSLTRFHFRGAIDFLNVLVVDMFAPRLGDIKVTFEEEFSSNLSILIGFIDRIKMHNSPRRADILFSEHDITISLMQPIASTSLKLTLPSKPLKVQLSFITRICTQFATFLVNVEDLRIDAQRPLTMQHGPYSENLLTPFDRDLFIGVRWLQVSGDLSSNIVHSLQCRNWPWPPWMPLMRPREFVLPGVQKLYILQPVPRQASFRDAVVTLITSRRRLSGHPIAVEYEPVTGTLYGNQSYATG